MIKDDRDDISLHTCVSGLNSRGVSGEESLCDIELFLLLFFKGDDDRGLMSGRFKVESEEFDFLL